MIKTVIQDYFQNFKITKLIIYVMIFFAYSFAYQQTSIPHIFHLDWAMMACVWAVVHFVFGDLFRNVGVPEIFFLVPKQNGALRSYIRTRLYLEVAFFFVLTLVSMMIKYALLCSKEIYVFYTGDLFYQLVTILLFILFLIQSRSAALIHTFQKTPANILTKPKLLLHYALSVVTFVTILWADAIVRTGMEAGIKQIEKQISKGMDSTLYPTTWNLSSNSISAMLITIFCLILLISLIHTIWYMKQAYKQLEQ